jgi:predicted nuclease of predicted toxin-antitoxin system
LRILADENIPHAVVTALRSRGIDVVAVREAYSGATDTAVLALAASENRVLLTFDKDFGQLAKVARLPPLPAGVVLLRLPLLKPTEIGRALADLITSRDDWEGRFAVVEPGRVRMRPLKPPA